MVSSNWETAALKEGEKSQVSRRVGGVQPDDKKAVKTAEVAVISAVVSAKSNVRKHAGSFSAGNVKQKEVDKKTTDEETVIKVLSYSTPLQTFA